MIQIATLKINTAGFRFSQRAKGGAKPDFAKFLSVVTPQYVWDWPHLSYIRQRLERVTRGDCKRLMLFVPPRHGKSEMTSIRYPVWRLSREPELRVIIGAYNQTLASKFSRKARRIASDYGLKLSDERTAVEDW